jgi:energy-coupling factor transporter ATP-binding protein EcfA2
MKNLIPREKEQILVIDRLGFSYEESIEDLADWYAEEETSSIISSPESEPTLKNISFSAKSGELILITGESGCGKTTLLQIINGIIPEFSSGKIDGDVLFCGDSIISMPVDRRGTLTGSVFQNPRSQFFNVVVKDELRFGCENFNLPAEEIERRVAALVKEFHLEPYLERSLFHLSGGEKQRVACLSVAAMQPPIMLYDEPSSNLDADGMRSLAQMMRTFKHSGVIQLVAEHRLAYLSELVDRVIFMKDGQLEEHFSGERLRSLSDEQLSRMGLRSTKRLPPPLANRQLAIRSCGERNSRIKTADIAPKDLYIESLGMSYSKTSQPFLQIEDYRFKASSIHALVAGNGMGKSTFLRSLAGLEIGAKGFVRYNNRRYSLKRMCRLCGFVFQDINRQLLTGSVYDELLLSLEESGLQAEEKEERIVSLTKKLELDNLLDAHPFSLSGGQKQRLAVAATLLMDRPILILDEPTSGLDLKHMVAMAEVLSEYSRNHLILLATHDQELLRLLDAEIHELLDPAQVKLCENRKD